MLSFVATDKHTCISYLTKQRTQHQLFQESQHRKGHTPQTPILHTHNQSIPPTMSGPVVLIVAYPSTTPTGQPAKFDMK